MKTCSQCILSANLTIQNFQLNKEYTMYNISHMQYVADIIEISSKELSFMLYLINLTV
jgi:hypothetical protein